MSSGLGISSLKGSLVKKIRSCPSTSRAAGIGKGIKAFGKGGILNPSDIEASGIRKVGDGKQGVEVYAQSRNGKPAKEIG